MGRFVAGCLGLLLILGGYAGTANAQAEAGAQSLLIAPGARSDGMGRAFVAVANDANAVWWNPGALAFTTGHDVSSMYAKLVPDLADDVFFSYTSYAQHVEGWGGIGFSLGYLSYGKSIATDVDGNELGTFTSYEVAPTVAYGTELMKDMGFGVALKLVRVDLAPADKTQDLQAHLALLQDARNEIDSYANINPALMQQDGRDEHSGVAINLLQKAGIAEIGTFLRNYRAWKIRLYRAIWNTIQHHWQAERYIRVTDSDGVKQFLQVNQLGLNQWGQPVITNAVGTLDVDIILDEGPDTINVMQDAYESIKDDPTVPWQIKLELMPMPSSIKKKIQQEMQQAQQAAAQKPDPKVQGEMIKAQTAQQKGQAEIAKAKLQAASVLQNAQQDQQQKRLDAMMQSEREAAEREKIRQQMIQSRQEHEFKMAELAEQRKTMQIQQAAKRKAALAPKPKKKAA